MKRIVYRAGSALLVFRLDTTTNDKIAPKGEKILQTYSYSDLQYEVAKLPSISQREFFSLDKAVCGDCPFSGNSGNRKCYTHKFMQFSGFLSQLRSIATQYPDWDSIPDFSPEIGEKIVSLARGVYVRFGTYGEPTLIDLPLVSSICLVAKNWTGYSHQYFRKPEYAAFFQASLENIGQLPLAEKLGFRAFVATKQALPGSGLVNCPASKESGYKSTCSKCGLCSGTAGKGQKSIWILQH